MTNNSRWSVDPFTNTETATPEQIERALAQSEAFKAFRRTGDPTKAIELGLFPPESEYDYEEARKVMLEKNEEARRLGIPA